MADNKMDTVSLFGIRVSKMNMRETVEYLQRVVEKRIPHQVITINPIMIMAALQDPGYMAVMREADLVVPDGAGVVWAAKHVGTPVAERVAGFDLMQELCSVGQTRGWKVYLLGAAPEIVRETARRLRERFPGLVLSGYRDGYFSAEQDEEVLADIRRAEPDLLFVARSAAGQEPWIHRYRRQLNVPVMMGVGGSFDVIAGKSRRAPLWMQNMRLEWLFRLLQEPWRYKRMMALPKFVLTVVRHKKDVQKWY
jgi:N-acetylglucosaminyldiphosphoundecaprenol N-acetyl-beta-D-mannosaminyltransferase